MRVLAIETSTVYGGVAVMDDSGLIAETRLNVKVTHSEKLMTAIEQTLRVAGIDLPAIDLFGVATGPGSFTGLRIGISAVKGFSYATGKPVVSVPTLEAFAWNFPFCSLPVCIMLDARKKEVYGAVFEWRNDGFERIIPELSVSPADLVKAIGRPALFAGEGSFIYREMIHSCAGGNAFFPAPHFMVPSASHVAYLSLRKAAAGIFADPVRMIPLYIRKSEAELKFRDR